MSGTHDRENPMVLNVDTTSTSSNLSPTPASGNQKDFQIVRKEGDAYYPTEPKYYVGGDIYTIWADYKETNEAYVGMDFFIPPKDVFPQHTHALEEEFQYVTDGTVNYRFGDASITATPGTFVYFPIGRPMGFNGTASPARAFVLSVPGPRYLELAGVPVSGPPQQVTPPVLKPEDLARVQELNRIYGGNLLFPGQPQNYEGIPPTLVVLPEGTPVPAQPLEGVNAVSIKDRPKFAGPFGGEYTSLASFAETGGDVAYSQFVLPPRTDFPAPIVSDKNEIYSVRAGQLSVKIGDRVEVATPDTFVAIAPGESYSIANLSSQPVQGLAVTVADTYLPKIQQYTQGRVVTSEPEKIGDGWIYTWGAFDQQGNPTSIGVTFTEAALDDMFEVTDPNDRFPRLVPHLNMPDMFFPARVFNLEYPQEVKDKTPFDHMGWYANSQGHAPPFIYDKPHVDVHFFLDTVQERERITGATELNEQLYKYPKDGTLNRDYILPTDPTTGLPATGDALQGAHWVDSQTPELRGQPFTETFIFGTYNGDVNFWEPMITKEFFASKPNFTKPIKIPDIVQEDGFYPSAYSIKYNPNFGEYTVSLDKFFLQQTTEENFFNEQYYLQTNADVADAVARGLFTNGQQHFDLIGNREGRNPSWRFDNKYYLTQYADVAAAVQAGQFTSAFQHYQLIGRGENRETGELFNRNYYLQTYQDVRIAIEQGIFQNAWEHYSRVGQFENRSPGTTFNPNIYLFKNQDVAEAVSRGQISAFQHYSQIGRYENRSAVAAPFGTTVEPTLGSNQLDDVLYAGASGSYLLTGNGDDVLIASSASDILEGGAGSDEFIFQAAFEGKGGLGGSDQILDYETDAGTGDTIKLRNIDTGVSISIVDINGSAVINVVNAANIDYTKGGDPATPSGTGNYSPVPIQSIALPGVTAAQLMTQGRLEVNGRIISDTTFGVTKTFGTYSYTVADVAGNSIFGDEKNNIVGGSFLSQEQLNDLRTRLSAITEIVIPGAAQSTDPSVNLGGTGRIPDSLLPREAFQDLVPTFDSSTINNDLIIGGPGDDLLYGGPGNDTIVGGLGVDVIIAGTGQDFVIGREGVDYIVYDSILDFRDRDNNPEDPISNALPDGRIGYIRLEEPYGIPLTDPFTTRTGPDIFLVNSKAFNRGIDPITNPQLAAQIGYLRPGTMISGDGTGTAATKNGQLKVGAVTVPTSDGPAADDLQPLFYYSQTAGRLFFDRDGTGTQFADFWMADMAIGTELPPGTPAAVPNILIYVY